MTQENVTLTGKAANGPNLPGCSGSLSNRLYRPAAVLFVVIVVLGVLLSIARAAIYKIRPYERGLHLRGGRFIEIDEPGWHFRIPMVDTTIGIRINERPGNVEQLAAMTSDDVTMDVSLLYTYRVSDPKRYALEVDDPDRIVFEFVKGKLRDVINTREMSVVMHSRAEINAELMEALRERETQYGVEFVMVQLQSASPPEEVVTAIKDRMVAVQQQQQATAEADQRRTLADADFYAAQKLADGEAYQIIKMAEADAQRIALTAQAQQEAVRAMLSTLDDGGMLAEQYIQVLIAQELAGNSKWIISNSGETVPVIELRDVSPSTETEGSLDSSE
ncbi:MAG: SPFH/Band 7/PHB domain protein [Chloroflexi bacterium]|nr:SPFH/Band 7/PHB domain protein [Chloroflexota bacterium]